MHKRGKLLGRATAVLDLATKRTKASVLAGEKAINFIFAEL